MPYAIPKPFCRVKETWSYFFDHWDVDDDDYDYQLSGVYFIWCGDGNELLYIGSSGDICHRVSFYHPHAKYSNVRHVSWIEFPAEVRRDWEAFLIYHLQPPLNRYHKKRRPVFLLYEEQFIR